jgi:hypothetical protein
MKRPAFERDALLVEFDFEVIETGRDDDRLWAVVASQDDGRILEDLFGSPIEHRRFGGFRQKKPKLIPCGTDQGGLEK